VYSGIEIVHGSSRYIVCCEDIEVITEWRKWYLQYWKVRA